MRVAALVALQILLRDRASAIADERADLALTQAAALGADRFVSGRTSRAAGR
ncbi:hypothetical protein AB5I41_24800 [Sphingomonas sp. MMS24-JH45]